MICTVACAFDRFSKQFFHWVFLKDRFLLASAGQSWHVSGGMLMKWFGGYRHCFSDIIFHVDCLLSEFHWVHPLILVPGSALLSSSWRNVDRPLGDWQCCCCLTSVCSYTVVPRRQKAKAIIPLAVWSEWQINPFSLSICDTTSQSC